MTLWSYPDASCEPTEFKPEEATQFGDEGRRFLCAGCNGTFPFAAFKRITR